MLHLHIQRTPITSHLTILLNSVFGPFAQLFRPYLLFSKSIAFCFAIHHHAHTNIQGVERLQRALSNRHAHIV